MNLSRLSFALQLQVDSVAADVVTVGFRHGRTDDSRSRLYLEPTSQPPDPVAILSKEFLKIIKKTLRLSKNEVTVFNFTKKISHQWLNQILRLIFQFFTPST